MKVTDFDYELPKELIAQTPVEPRDRSRLMIVDRKAKRITHDHFYNLLKYVEHGDQFVFNDTRVIPARLFGKKESGGKVELLLTKRLITGWEFIGKNVGRAKKIVFEKNIIGEINGNIIIFNSDPLAIGHVPLPPYIIPHPPTPSPNLVEGENYLGDRYQTVYAREPGSAAAPTAGLHFTEELLDKIPNKSFVTLNVGLGTFQPLKKEIVEENELHAEYYDVGDFEKRGDVVAVGTTTVRVLESFANTGVESGETNIFIYPGYKFKLVDKLVTNFHLPKSSLLMLTCAFGGKELIMKAYAEAVKEKYRFFSFGDAMLIV